MPLREFLKVLRTRWKIVVAVTLLVIGIAAGLTSMVTPIYTAQASFFLSTQTTKGNGDRGTYVLTTNDLNTYVAVLGSPAVTDPLRARLGMPPGAPIDVSAAVNDKASILTVTARSSNARQAARIANATGPQLAVVAGRFSALLQATGQRVSSTTISPATVPATPTSPNVVRNLTLAALAGLFLGVGLAFVRHAMDTRVRDAQDLRALAPSPVLASLPAEKSKKTGPTVEQAPHGMYAEAVRRLRTNLMFVDVTTGGHSFVVTSAVPGEGKTTTAVNLALAMAHAGSRVLLVDGDLRNPSVADALGMPGAAGLTTVLLGNVAVEDVVQRWKDSQLYVLAAGQVPPNPSELLGSEAMQSLFSKLTPDYDFILVDSPPVVPVIDAVLLDKLTGGTVMVVASGRTKKRELSSALKSLETVGAQVSGFALNMVSPGDAEAHYGYYRYDDKKRGTKHNKRDAKTSVSEPKQVAGVDEG